MRTEVIKADTIGAAAERIVDELKEDASSTTSSYSSRGNVIYFDGWDGLGASAVLRAVTQRLAVASEDPAGLQFDQIIHVDCLKWKSRRAVQRAIAEQMELPTEVMEIFDKKDEDDDFNGLTQESRAEIPQVIEAITYHRMQKRSRRCLLIFQNGSGAEVDLTTFGFPLYGYSRTKVLWTFQGGLRLYPRIKVDRVLESTRVTDVFFSASFHEPNRPEVLSYLVHQEAAEVARRNAGSIIDRPGLVYECFMYFLKLCCMGNQFMMCCDLATHVGNYLVCDGIIQSQQEGDIDGTDDNYDDDKWWQAADALHHDMQLDVDYYNDHKYSHLVRFAEIMPCWTSPTYRSTQILDGAISNRDIFQNFDKLCVLKLSHCNFSFSSPPFLCCNNLRFLWLNHCQDQATNTDGADKKEKDISQCFQKLWVLDMHDTCCDVILSARMMDHMSELRELNVMGAQDWDMGQLNGRLPNIRKLQVTKSTIHCSSNCSENDIFSRMKKMKLLRFSGNRILSGMRSLSIAANNFIQTIIIDDGCVGLEEISFRGCANLKSVLLKGLFTELDSLDISGTSVKTLDLSEMVAKKLDKLALGCNKLCAILWPPVEKRKGNLSKLHIDTIECEGSPSATGSSLSSLTVKYGSRAPTEYSWYIFISDLRLLRSLVELKPDFSGGSTVHVEIFSPSCLTTDVGDSKDERIIKSSIGNGQLVLVNIQSQQQHPEIDDKLSVYAGVNVTLKDHVQQASVGGDGDAPIIPQIWPCPPIPKPEYGIDRYMYIQDQALMMTKLPVSGEVFSTTTITIPEFICYNTGILHVHDSKFITCVPGPAPPLEGSWRWLLWCRVERCPSLDCVFACPQIGSESGGGSGMRIFPDLQTLWSSQLQKARCIWKLSRPSSAIVHFNRESFEKLKFMHVDFCPRLTHVLPLSETLLHGPCLRLLRILEIIWCSDLRVVFPLETDDEENNHGQKSMDPTTVEFPNLNHVHLHELPMLQSICGSGRIYAPNLETIKIRGCWSLMRLPAVGSNKKVKCDCEKEWWDRLKWDGIASNHYWALYEPIHPRYYKKTLLRCSMLR